MTLIENAFTEEVAPEIVGRSEAQRFAECPQKGWQVHNGHASDGGADADVGNECHRLIAEVVKLRHSEAATPANLREHIDAGAANSRPDVQPRVIAAMRRAAYPLSRLLCAHDNGEMRHPDDLIRYDGGDGQYSGQLAADVILPDGVTVRATGELDLLMATASPEEVALYDWKSGWKWWTGDEVKGSFQFQWYAWLIFSNYPGVHRVIVRVFMTPTAETTSAITFERGRDMFVIGRRIIAAIQLRQDHKDAKSESSVPAWPSAEKCCICPAATICPFSHEPDAQLSDDPQDYLKHYAVISAAADSMKANLTTYVRKVLNGNDLIAGDIAFGTNKPKATRAAACDIYRNPDHSSQSPSAPDTHPAQAGEGESA